jgi:glycosyltransferase involved in cell wall biosynthesis
MGQHKKRILLIGDMPGWAFDHIIDFVRVHLKSEYEFYYDFTVYNPRDENPTKSDSNEAVNPSVIEEHYRKNYPIHQLPILKRFTYKTHKILNEHGWISRDPEGKKRRIRSDQRYDCIVFLDFYMDLDGNFDHINSPKRVKGIYTDGFPPKGIQFSKTDVPDFLKSYYHDATVMLVGAKCISEIYQPFSKLNIFEANLAYDETIFSPSKHQDQRNLNTLTLGWTGNPNRSFKGFYEVILPTVEGLKEEGYAIELRTQFSGSLHSLADFWQDIDLALIASEADAGPSMFMEASLCGVPSISTRIGMPAFVIKDGENGKFIERNTESLRNSLLQVYNDRPLIERWGRNIRTDYIQKLGTEVQVGNWRNLFNAVFNEA